MIILLATISTATILLYRRFKAKHAKSKTSPPKIQADLEAQDNPDLQLPTPTNGSGTVRRTTGKPQTFYDWVRSENSKGTSKVSKSNSKNHDRYLSLEHGPGPTVRSEASPIVYSKPTKIHSRYPSLEHGPGPTVSSEASSVYSRPIISRAGTMVSANRPVTRDSVGASSLRQAVLDIGALSGDEEVSRQGIEKEVKPEKVAVRGYSGAWP
jgi:hypothetical protein